jgi:carbon monoxide dehydrogenase subunit G
MIHFEGVQSFPLPVAEVAARLADAGFLAHCVPEAQVTEASPDHSVGKVKPKLSFLSGGLIIEATVTAREPGKSVSYQIVSKVIGASSTVTAKLDFVEAEGGGTTVNWHGDLTAVTGLLKMVPKGLMEASAKKVIDEVWESVTKKLHGTSGELEWKGSS